MPSSSQHPDSRPITPHHKLPRDKSTLHDATTLSRPAADLPIASIRDLIVVRIPLKSAKHHFGVFRSRGQRPYIEDAYQAGTIDVPAFARRQPVSLTRKSKTQLELKNPTSTETIDPQVFYFGLFDGHGGSECSDFLKNRLHVYIEESAKQFQLESSLVQAKSQPDARKEQRSKTDSSDTNPSGETEQDDKRTGLQRSLVRAWKDLVGGYYRRFKPVYFSTTAGGQGNGLVARELKGDTLLELPSHDPGTSLTGIETVLEWAFLKADLDFVKSQVANDDDGKPDKTPSHSQSSKQLSQENKGISESKRFKGGSTCSVALISTPTPTPFWHPAATSTIITAHCGDSRILLCDTAVGKAIALTSTHHPNNPLEAQRMRRYAAAFVTDSFGEERVGGLANTRAFGDMPSKRIGVSAEPEIMRIQVHPAQYSFMVMVSDGVSGQLTDQEIVDIIKEARTPEQGAQDLVSFATEISADGDNATALVLRLGGYERRQEGGGGSFRTKEARDFKRKEALDPRSRRR